ncbi:MAG TPA: alkaline phosphatase family protein [Solirubrobacteraceae bacterium]|nr:alkaline phosphatase family protein [Solirubrobacteraceae bacterium]
MISRREFLVSGAGAALASGLLPGVGLAAGHRRVSRASLAGLTAPSAQQIEALRVLGRTSLRMPGALPHPALAAGTDTLPRIEHVVVLMMENHSYDNLFGMLGRIPGERARGNGFRIASDGYPANSNPQADGKPLRAFHMPSTCQLSSQPSQEWVACHEQYNGGRNNGFVTSPSGEAAMGYWDQYDLPFTYGLAKEFPIGDHWFCSVLGQTYPNRRYLIAGTSMGMVDDNQVALLGEPAKNGTIFNQFTTHGISWKDYYAEYPNQTAATPNLYAANDFPWQPTNGASLRQFHTDAANGSLPSFSLLEPNYSVSSQENPQNIIRGEALLSQVVKAIGHSPKWKQTALIITYDEHGGYYDHVPPPAALAPDNIAPVPPEPGDSTYDGFKRYGFRVPSVIVSPYAKRRHVSHKVYDHTSILAFVERKWNLPALTLRDANANDLTDFFDVSAMASGRPTFPRLPKLAKEGEDASTLRCDSTGAGAIPPRNPRPEHVQIVSAKASGRRRGVVVRLRASAGEQHHATLQLRHGSKVVASRRLALITGNTQERVLRVHGHLPPAGHYEAVVLKGHHRLARHSVTVR